MRSHPRRRGGRPWSCAARGRRGSAARWTGRPAYVDALGHREDGGREVQDAADADLDHPVGHRLRGHGRRRDHADADAVLGDHLLQVVEAADLQAGDDLAVPGVVGVEQRDGAEPPRGEAGVVRPARGRGCRSRRSPPASPGSGRSRGRSGSAGTPRRTRPRGCRRSRGGRGPCAAWRCSRPWRSRARGSSRSPCPPRSWRSAPAGTPGDVPPSPRGSGNCSLFRHAPRWGTSVTLGVCERANKIVPARWLPHVRCPTAMRVSPCSVDRAPRGAAAGPRRRARSRGGGRRRG